MQLLGSHWALFSPFFSPLCSNSFSTPWISPAESDLPVKLQPLTSSKAGGDWIAPLAAHPGSTPLLAPRGFLKSDSGCSGLSPMTQFVVSASLWHIHTHSQQLPVAWGGLGSSFLFWAHFSCMLAAYIAVFHLRSALTSFQASQNTLPRSSNGTQTFHPVRWCLSSCFQIISSSSIWYQWLGFFVSFWKVVVVFHTRIFVFWFFSTTFHLSILSTFE